MTQTITDIVFDTLSRHFELTTNGVYKHCAGQPGITHMKTVANALDRLRKQGCATSYRCEERGIYLWQAVKPARQVVDPIEESLDQADDQCADASNMMGEMASDVAELEQPQPVVNESLTTEAVTDECSATSQENLTVAGTDTESRAKPRKPYTPNKIAGAYAYRGALVIKLDRKAHAKSITLSAKDMAMLSSIYGNMA